MDDLKFSIDDELFRVSQRRQPTGMMSYDFEWLNGPDNGNYGFTVGLSVDWSDPRAQRTPEQLMDEARGFIEGFYEPGGIGEADFPEHIPARTRRTGDQETVRPTGRYRWPLTMCMEESLWRFRR